MADITGDAPKRWEDERGVLVETHQFHTSAHDWEVQVYFSAARRLFSAVLPPEWGGARHLELYENEKFEDLIDELWVAICAKDDVSHEDVIEVFLGEYDTTYRGAHINFQARFARVSLARNTDGSRAYEVLVTLAPDGSMVEAEGESEGVVAHQGRHASVRIPFTPARWRAVDALVRSFEEISEEVVSMWGGAPDEVVAKVDAVAAMGAVTPGGEEEG